MKYFNDSDLFELFEFNYTDPRKCDTMSMLLKRDGFTVSKTPTVDKHIAFLRSLQSQTKITGLSLNSNLYSKGGKSDPTDYDELKHASDTTDDDRSLQGYRRSTYKPPTR